MVRLIRIPTSNVERAIAPTRDRTKTQTGMEEPGGGGGGDGFGDTVVAPTVVKLAAVHSLVRFIALERTRQ